MSNEYGDNFPDFHGWCYCGRPLFKDLSGVLYCKRHKYDIEKKEVRQKIGKWSGRSKSEFHHNEYK